MSLVTWHLPAPQLMTSALVYVRDNKCNLIKCRALLDTCATANFISESILKRLNIRIDTHSLPINAIGGMNTESTGIVRITIQSIHDGFEKDITCLAIPIITDSIPSETFPRNLIKIPANIRLADPEFHLPRPVDLLIGAGATLSMFTIGQINLSHDDHDLYVQKTRLGWVVAGGAPSQNPSKVATCQLTCLEDLIRKFWTVEEVASNTPRSNEEVDCETHFSKTVSRDDNGRYIVRLPFRDTNIRLGDSRRTAFKRLLSLENKLNTNPDLKAEYTRIIDEYIQINHMSRTMDADEDGYYMPHHAIIKETSHTTKVRVVFDASAKTTNGVSLNELLMVGPTIQSGLFSHLIRFRTYNYVITADIEKMYRQVWVHEDDRRYQRILWRRNGKIETFQLNTLTFGVASSPFLAIRTIQKLADDEALAYPRAANILKSHLYVDDLLIGAETIEEARAVRDEIIELLARGGFVIRQWASNNECVINDLASNSLHANFTLNADRALKILGIVWNARDDTICYSANSIKGSNRVTKRSILSEIAKIFDPLGLLGPIISYVKKLMQDVWRCGLQWDESVPQNIHTAWLEFARQWESLGQIYFERRLLIAGYHDIELHGFCDASAVGYGACIYVRSRDESGNVLVRLLCAKSRVAPLKTLTIPRLELCGALILAQLYGEIIATLRRC
ncbi:PREDICTED: uncharacterized protein LOC108770842 [Trachymyrmex cornetzi]|uniref:uncharacterized protein LOC108770842 n=1 Tax=Trachymyrmex cornetzi TaxID=471704 RepID=UPI00084F4EDD|nr:PREDICTED: uncharacterized protein LOC108770842 [Trachymyrmex cornetzi]